MLQFCHSINAFQKCHSTLSKATRYTRLSLYVLRLLQGKLKALTPASLTGCQYVIIHQLEKNSYKSDSNDIALVYCYRYGCGVEFVKLRVYSYRYRSWCERVFRLCRFQMLNTNVQ